MAEFQRYQRSETVTPAGVSNSKARSYQSLSARLKSFANQQGQLADQSAAREGELAGQTAASGKSSGVQMQDINTIRGRAFNKGAMMAHAAQIQIDVRSDVANYARTNHLNVEGFDSQVEGMKAGLLKEVDPILRPHAEQEINSYAASARSKIQDNVYRQQMDENLATITTAVEGMEEDALQAAREGNEALYESKISQISAIYTEGVNDGLLDANKIAQAGAAFSEKIDEQLVLGSFDRIINSGDLKEAQTELDKFKKSKNKDLQPGTKDAVVQKVQAKINSQNAIINKERAAQKAQLAAKEKILEREVKDLNYALDKGYVPEDMDQIYEAAKGTKFEKDVKGAIAFGKIAVDFIGKNPSEQANAISVLKSKKNISAQGVKLIERLEKVYDYTQKGLKEDALSLAIEQGIVKDPVVFDITNPGSLQQRLLHSETASAHYGVNVSPLTKQEAISLTNLISESDVEQQSLILGNLVNGFGENSAEVLEQMKDSGPKAHVVAGGLLLESKKHNMQSRAIVSRNILLGTKQLELNTDAIAKDFDLSVDAVLLSTYADRPEQQAIIKQGVRALYAQKMAMQGRLNEGSVALAATDVDILHEAIVEVTGGLVDVEWDGSGFLSDDDYQIEVPVPGMGVDDVEDWMDSITAADIDAMGGVKGFKSKDAAEMINDGVIKLVSAGDGRYKVQTYSGRFFSKADGSDFNLTYGVKGEQK